MATQDRSTVRVIIIKAGLYNSSDAIQTSTTDEVEAQSARRSGQHHSARSSYSVKRDLIVWDGMKLVTFILDIYKIANDL